MREDRPSSTAVLIAAATVFLSRDARVSDLVPAGAAEVCEDCLRALSRLGLVRAVSHPALRWAARLAERATVPGLPLHFMLRKRWIEETVRAALAGGCAQLLVVGAGFDTLAPRLAREFPRARFFEIDHPATQAWKRRALGDAGENLSFVAADLSRVGLEAALAGSGFDPSKRSAFVVEGLLMYLDDAEIERVFGALRGLLAEGSRLVFTVMEPTPDGRFAFHNASFLVRRLLARWSEPFKSALAREDAAAFLARFGFALRALAPSETLRETYLAPSGRAGLVTAHGEMIVAAERRQEESPR